MKFKKPHFIVDYTKISKESSNRIQSTYKFFSLSEADAIVVLGGDGFMLDILKQYQDLDLPFYGINKGTVGFLMNQNPVKTIGINDEARKDSHLVYVNQADGLKGILNRDFDEWSNFDSWESISVQQWIFSRALEVFRGKKIDIKCDCCENNNLIPNDFESIKKEKCFGKKSAYMIEKVVDEIVLAKARRESDGTYSA